MIDCTNDYADSVNDNVRNICSIANSFQLDLFLSLHMNAGGGTGTEVFTIDGNDKAYAGNILSGLVSLGFKDRGIKDGSNLYVIKRINAPACLIEICFVDNKQDYNMYCKLGVDKVAKAICNAITPMNETESDGDLTMGQYEELKKMIQNLTPVIYNYIDDNMPDWARPTIQKLVDKGIVQGDENGLGLTYNDLRHLVWNDRAGLYDK